MADLENMSKGDLIGAIKNHNIFYLWSDLSDKSLDEIKKIYNEVFPNAVVNHKKGISSRVIKKK
jgi:uncharacterized membrane-anchored protein